MWSEIKRRYRPNTFPKNLPTKYASFTLKGYFTLPLIPYLNGFASGEEIFSKNPSRREGHYCPNPLTRSHFKTGVFGGWDGVLSSLSHPKSFQAGRESKGSALASISHLSKVSLPSVAWRKSRKANKLKVGCFATQKLRRCNWIHKATLKALA